MPGPKPPTEHQEQARFVCWARGWLPHQLRRALFAIPNGGKRGKREAVRLKAEGVTAGVPDLFLSVPTKYHHGAYIEMKRKGGRLSDAQKDMIDMLIKLGYACYVCHGFDEARAALIEYMEDWDG